MIRYGWLPFALLGLTLLRHQLVDVIAETYEHPDIARRGLFYIASGLNLLALYAVVWRLMPTSQKWLHTAVGLVCAYGMLEESEVVICRMAKGLDTAAIAPMWGGLCDQISGLPMSTVTLAIPVYIAYLLATQGNNNG